MSHRRACHKDKPCGRFSVAGLAFFLACAHGGYTFEGGLPLQAGSPKGLNQTVLVIYVRASDDVTPNLATLRTSEQAEFGNVGTFYAESSFDQLSFAYTHAPANGWYQLPRTYDAYIWTAADIANAPNPTAKQQAQDNQALLQDATAFFTEALQAAVSNGFNPGNFSQVVVEIIGPFFRGQAYTPFNLTLTDQAGNNFQIAPPIIAISTNMGWSRTAHEFGHAFGGFADLYGAPNRGIGNWSIMDCTDCGSQSTAWHKDNRAQWFSGSQLKILQRPSGINHLTDVTTLAPYETETPAAGGVQSLRLDVGGQMHLYVENRQKIAGQTGSQSLPANGVIITDSDDNAGQVNASRPPILLFGGPVPSGSSFTDQTYGPLKIDVSGAPPTLQVTTNWGPDPFLDLRITPWSPPPWESPDIWIDSQVNGWDTYEYNDAVANPGVAGNPIRNGDRPRTGRANRIYARVFNDGNITATNVRVSFYVTDPQGVGDSGNWSLIDRATIPQIAAGANALAMVLWTPQANTHTCLKALIDVQTGELNANNNSAQENISDFDTTSTSPYHVIESEIQVANSTKRHQQPRLEINRLPSGWKAWVSERFLSLAPGAVQTVKYRIDPGTGGKLELGSRADVNITGFVMDQDREVPLGGVTSSVHLVRPSTVTLSGDVPKTVSLNQPTRVVLVASITPAAPGLAIALDVAEQGSKAYTMATGATDASGRVMFDLVALAKKGIVTLVPGRTYRVRADFYGSPSIAAATSQDLQLQIAP